MHLRRGKGREGQHRPEDVRQAKGEEGGRLNSVEYRKREGGRRLSRAEGGPLPHHRGRWGPANKPKEGKRMDFNSHLMELKRRGKKAKGFFSTAVPGKD